MPVKAAYVMCSKVLTSNSVARNKGSNFSSNCPKIIKQATFSVKLKFSSSM